MEAPTATQVNRRQELLNAAAQLIHQHGYAATGIRDIAAQAGMEIGSFYTYFPSKDALLWELADHCACAFEQAATPIITGPLNTLPKLKELILAHIQVVLQLQWAASVFVQEWKHLGESQRAAYAQRRDSYEGHFRSLIRQGIHEGQFLPIDERMFSLMLLSSLNWTYQWYSPEGELRPNELAEQLAGISLNGIIRHY